MKLIAKVSHLFPPSTVNKILLHFPSLYKFKAINYESGLEKNYGLRDLFLQLEKVKNLEGNIIECGSARCGTSIIMAKYLKSKNIHKIVYACDSFEGFNPDELQKERKKRLTSVTDETFTRTSYEYVKKKIDILGFSDVVFPVKGFFQKTLPTIKSKYCFGLIDCDLEDSMIYSTETIWPNLVSGGIILLDDYYEDQYKGARVAIKYLIKKFENEILESGLMNRLYYIRKK